MDKEEVLLRVKHLLEKKYGAEAGIFIQQGQVLLKRASRPDAPIIPEELEAIVQQVREEFNLPPLILIGSIYHGDTILVGLNPDHQ